MLVRFTQTRRISENGHSVRCCEAGQEYDLADTAARHAINQGWAEDMDTRTNEERFQEFLQFLKARRA